MRRSGFIEPQPDVPDPLCEVCEREASACVCPECPTCGTHGDPRCYKEHGLEVPQKRFGVKTWMIEALVVFLVLALVLILTGSPKIEGIGAAAVLATFLHAQVGFRLQEAEERRIETSVECFRWQQRYFVMKEALWFGYFASRGAWSALVGVVVFLLYPIWRQIHLRRRPANG
jgi:hypothetical protein